MNRVVLAGRMAGRRKGVAEGRIVDVEGLEREGAAEAVGGSLNWMAQRRTRDGGL
jgi:hypothetical protein